MRLNSKVTWGLAWTGLAVVLAVPSADFLTGKLGDGKAAVITSTTDPVKPGNAATKTASITTTKTKTGVIITPAGGTAPVLTDPVDAYAKTGKPLPDYISSNGTTTASTGVKSDTTQVASIDPVAPTPFPARPPDVVQSVLPKPVLPKPVVTDPVQTGSIPAKSADPVVIVDQPPAPVQEAAVDNGDHPVPPAPIVDESATWRAKGLARYLDRDGLLDKSQSSASVVVVKRPSNYDPDGFYLSDGPNDSRAARRARLERLLNDRQFSDEEYDDGTSFSLF